MHSAEISVSVFTVSSSRAPLLGEMKEKPIAHLTGGVIHGATVEMFLT